MTISIKTTRDERLETYNYRRSASDRINRNCLFARHCRDSDSTDIAGVSKHRDGAPLDFSNAQPEGRDTPGVKAFFQTGVDPYIDDKSCLKKGEIIFLTACSGCHGLIGEGKIGPGLNDDYWTYPKNTEDKGLFETIFEGATAQMGPHYDLTLDEILQVMAWVRHLYKDDVDHAYWLNAEQKKNYKPYQVGEKFPDNPPGMCANKK